MALSAPPEQDSLSGQGGELPRAGALVRRFALFQGGRGCQLEVDPASAALRCRCDACADWAAYVEGRLPGGPAHPQYEVLTQELLDALARYIWQRAAQALEAARPGPFRVPFRVLEVGGGDGRLSHHLRGALGALPLQLTRSSGKNCLASYGRMLWLRENRQEVQLQPVGPALAEHQPHLVLASWMPLGDDWTGAFRAQPSLLEYLLIGEPDSDMCGDAEATWGVGADEECSHAPDQRPTALSAPAAGPSGGEARKALSTEGHPAHPQGSGAAHAAPVEGVKARACVCGAKADGRPLYAREGFSRHDLPLVEVQLCRMDSRWQTRGRSRVVSFRRSL